MPTSCAFRATRRSCSRRSASARWSIRPKGYSATLPIIDPAAAPTVSITDDAKKIVFTRLGDRLRVAGTAELSGYNLDLNRVRCEALTRRAREWFGGAIDTARAEVLDRTAAGDAIERPADRQDALSATCISTPVTARSAGRWPRIRQGACRSRFGPQTGGRVRVSGQLRRCALRKRRRQRRRRRAGPDQLGYVAPDDRG